MKKKLPAIFAIVIGILFSINGCGSTGSEQNSQSNKYQVTVSASPAEGGAVSPENGEHEEGTSLDITADPSEGWRFAHWEGDYQGNSSSATVTVEQDMEITGVFVQKEYKLAVNTEGEGTVDETVVKKTKDYKDGTVVELTANPAEGYSFVEWKGAVTGSDNPAQVTMEGAKEVTAVFQKKDYALTITVEGQGAVSEEVIKAKGYKYGAVVGLSANPAEGYSFVEWKGAVTGSDNPVQVTMEGAKEVTAVFQKKDYALTIVVEGQGAVSERVIKAKGYKYGTAVELTANPAEGYEFVVWQGALSSTDNPAQITVDEPKEVTAVFEKKRFKLSITTMGEGSVTKSPSQVEYVYNSKVSLAANAAEGFKFVEWQGDITSTENQVQLTLDEAKDVTAVFEKLFYLAENGITIKCSAANVGDSGTVNRVIYTKRESSQITTGNAATTCTSGITDMSHMFTSASSFNGDVSSWDVSSVTEMNYMFYHADSFNRDLSSWDVNSVTNMRGMFSSAGTFNGDISSWDVSSVTDMFRMFYEAGSFNRDLSSWNVSSVTNMGGMFSSASSFNRDLNNWNVSSVTDMSAMFAHASSFNGDLSSWNVSSVTDMDNMFTSSTFNGDVSSWDVSSVTDMTAMFFDTPFNGDLSGWDVSSVTDMRSMFKQANSFNGDLSSWDVSNVAAMGWMFYNSDFGGDISGWCVTNIASEPTDFAAFAPLEGDITKMPKWGTCPAK